MSLQILISSGCRLVHLQSRNSAQYIIYIFFGEKMWVRGHIASHSFGGRWWNFRNQKTCSTENRIWIFTPRIFRTQVEVFRSTLDEGVETSPLQSVSIFPAIQSQLIGRSLWITEATTKYRYLNIVVFYVLRVRFRFFHVSLDTNWMGWKSCDRSHWKSDSRRAHEYWRVAKKSFSAVYFTVFSSFLWKSEEKKGIECRFKKLCKKFKWSLRKEVVKSANNGLADWLDFRQHWSHCAHVVTSEDTKVHSYYAKMFSSNACKLDLLEISMRLS